MKDKTKTIIAIMGKTASGKDTIANYITNKYAIPAICSYATRNMRSEEKDGVEHYFISKEKMAQIMETEHILGYTKNEKTGIEYCATLESMNSNIAVYIINPDGLRWLEQHNPDVKLVKIYVYLEEEIIKKRALSRGDSEELINIRLDSERDEFDTYYNQVLNGSEDNVNVVFTNSDIVFKDIDKIIRRFFSGVQINHRLEDLGLTRLPKGRNLTNKTDRLTFKAHDGGMFVKESDVKTFEVEDEVMHTGNAIRKLADYEDLEEQGKLLYPKCLPGDYVWEISRERNIISEYEVTSIRYGINKTFHYIWVLREGIYGDLNGFKDEEIGKTIFLTKSAAESALQEMKAK